MSTASPMWSPWTWLIRIASSFLKSEALTSARRMPVMNGSMRTRCVPSSISQHAWPLKVMFNIVDSLSPFDRERLVDVEAPESRSFDHTLGTLMPMSEVPLAWVVALPERVQQLRGSGDDPPEFRKDGFEVLRHDARAVMRHHDGGLEPPIQGRRLRHLVPSHLLLRPPIDSGRAIRAVDAPRSLHEEDAAPCAECGQEVWIVLEAVVVVVVTGKDLVGLGIVGFEVRVIDAAVPDL